MWSGSPAPASRKVGLRVLAICEYPSLNGGEQSLLEAARCLPADRVRWLFAAPPTGPLADRVRAAGWDLEPLECTDRQGRRVPREVLRARLAELMRRHRPDVVHANSVSMSRLAGPVVCDMGVAGVGHLRDIVRLSAAAACDLAAHRRLLAVSAATRDWYGACGVPLDRIEVEYNGVDLERFAPRAPSGYLHTQLGIARSARLVGSIGQIGVRKGTDLFLAAAARVVAAVPDVHFLVVGRRYSQKPESCAFEQQVLRQAAHGVLAGRVHFLDVRSDIDRLLNELAVYVHAARQEPLGRVLLESAAAGLPVVATDVGGTREIFGTDPPSAVLVPAGAAELLARAVCDVLSSAALRRELGGAARRRAEAAFDLRRAAARLLGHYVELADPASGRHAVS